MSAMKKLLTEFLLAAESFETAPPITIFRPNPVASHRKKISPTVRLSLAAPGAASGGASGNLTGNGEAFE
jgi:hypothetical protein